MEYCNIVISLYEILHKTVIISPQTWYTMKGLQTAQITKHHSTIQLFKKEG